MPKGKDELFADFDRFAVTHGYGDAYQRNPHQSVPLDCGFIRFRYPGGGLFIAAGIIKFRQREHGVTACEAFVACSNEPLELQMSRWRRWKHAVRAWWPNAVPQQ
jgi:hypothetical protein